MATISKSVVDADLRNTVFTDLFTNYSGDEMEFNGHNYQKINERQYGVILTDKNGIERYVRVGAIVAEEREDKTARELMQEEIDKYQAAQAKKEETARKRAEKAATDKAKREAAKKKKEEEEE